MDQENSQPTQPVEPAQSTPQPTQPIVSLPQNKYNRMHVVIMAVAVLGVVACVSYALGMLSQRSVDTAVNPYLKEISSTPVPTKTAVTPTTNPTVDWQTYQGQGFSFNYPQDWVLKKDPITPQRISFYDPTSGSPTGNGGSIVFSKELSIFSSSSDQTADEYIADIKTKQTQTNVGDFSQKTITLNGQQMPVYHIGGEGTVGWYIPFFNGTTMVEFGPIATDPSTDSIQLQIVKSFSFSK